jgi:hypothetical protein
MMKSKIDFPVASWGRAYSWGRTHPCARRPYLEPHSFLETTSGARGPSACRLNPSSGSASARGLKAGVIAATATFICCLFTLVGPGDTAANSSGDTSVSFPKGYHKWVHVKSTIVTAQHTAFAKQACEKPCVGGIYHFYANEKALEGYRTGKFPDGAILADDLHDLVEAPVDGHFTPEGPLRVVGVMVKASQRYNATGGWGYESFNPGNETVGALTAAEKTECYTCHVSRKDHDFVFTHFTE